MEVCNYMYCNCMHMYMHALFVHVFVDVCASCMLMLHVHACMHACVLHLTFPQTETYSLFHSSSLNKTRSQ